MPALTAQIWSVFEAAATDLDELTETVPFYISFCNDMCIPTRTYLTCAYGHRLFALGQLLLK